MKELLTTCGKVLKNHYFTIIKLYYMHALSLKKTSFKKYYNRAIQINQSYNKFSM